MLNIPPFDNNFLLSPIIPVIDPGELLIENFQKINLFTPEEFLKIQTQTTKLTKLETIYEILSQKIKEDHPLYDNLKTSKHLLKKRKNSIFISKLKGNEEINILKIYTKNVDVKDICLKIFESTLCINIKNDKIEFHEHIPIDAKYSLEEITASFDDDILKISFPIKYKDDIEIKIQCKK